MRGEPVTTLARFEQPRDLVDLLDNGVGEPLSADSVVQPANGAPAEVHFLDVVDAGAAFDLVDLEPGVQMLWHTVLEPTPPLAPMNAMTLPTGSVSGLL